VSFSIQGVKSRGCITLTFFNRHWLIFIFALGIKNRYIVPMTDDSDIDDLSLQLFAQEALGQVGSQDYIDWAVALLGQERDSPALRRLAACYAEDDLVFEIRPWFEQSLQELGLERPEYNDVFWLDVAAYWVHQLLGQHCEPQAGLQALTRIIQQLGYRQPLLDGFSDLSEALEHLPADAHTAQLLYPELAEHSPWQCLQLECQLFRALRPLNLPADFNRQVVCQACQHQGLPQQRRVAMGLAQKLSYQLSQKPLPWESVCSQCRSTDLLWLRTATGRRWWWQQHA